MKWRRGIVFLLWILSLVGISFFGGTISYGFFWAITFIPVISIVYLLFVYMQFRIYQEIESRIIVSKQPMPYFFVLQNETYFAFAGLSVSLFSDFSHVTDMPDGEEYELLPGDKYTYQSSMICKYRGEYEVGVKEITITDFLRLFRFRYKNPGTIKAVVYPRIIYKSELESIKDIFNPSINEVFFNQTVADVVTRDYIPGDPLKRIHWKASAREQKLKTRNMLGERKQDLMIVYDTKRYSDRENEYLPLENQILELVLALGVFFAGKNIGYSVLCGQNGVNLSQVQGLSQFDEWYHQTANIAFDAKEDVETILRQFKQNREFANCKTVLIVLHEVRKELMGLLQSMTEEGFYVILYLVTDENIEEYAKQANERLRIIGIPVEGNLEEIL